MRLQASSFMLQDADSGTKENSSSRGLGKDGKDQVRHTVLHGYPGESLYIHADYGDEWLSEGRTADKGMDNGRYDVWATIPE